MNEVNISAVIFAVVGIAFIALGVPLFQERVGPNSWYGCRTTKSLSDKRIWYAINRVTGRDMIITGVLVLISSLAVFIFGGNMNPTLVAIILLAVMGCATIGMVVNNIRTLKGL